MKIEFSHPDMEDGVLQCKSCGSVVMDSARHLHKEWHLIMEGKIQEAKHANINVYGVGNHTVIDGWNPDDIPDTEDVQYVLDGFKLKGQDDQGN
jgi:hypothetical protein